MRDPRECIFSELANCWVFAGIGAFRIQPKSEATDQEMSRPSELDDTDGATAVAVRSSVCVNAAWFAGDADGLQPGMRPPADVTTSAARGQPSLGQATAGDRQGQLVHLTAGHSLRLLFWPGRQIFTMHGRTCLPRSAGEEHPNDKDRLNPHTDPILRAEAVVDFPRKTSPIPNAVKTADVDRLGSTMEYKLSQAEKNGRPVIRLHWARCSR
jgi:hypothetical protein